MDISDSLERIVTTILPFFMFWIMFQYLLEVADAAGIMYAKDLERYLQSPSSFKFWLTRASKDPQYEAIIDSFNGLLNHSKS